MQRISFLFCLVLALYVSCQAYATEAVSATSVKRSPAQAEKPVPHLALILPLKSATFGEAADAVRQGFLAATTLQAQLLPVRVYECTDESTDIIARYQQAIDAGARAVAGPLTRNGVAVLAGYSGISVPTLALNMVESKGADKLYFFGLTAETEARQIAQLASAAGLHSAILISNNLPLSKRLSQAFTEEWKLLGNKITKKIQYHDDPAPLADLPTHAGQMVFLAADAETAHLIRPYLNMALPVYATSQVFIGNTETLTNYDLSDVHFIDMPWLLQPDHPAVMAYPHANSPLDIDRERLYALGIDAFRLLQIMLDNQTLSSLPLDGVTGRIHLNAHQQFERESIPALFWQGRGLPPETIAAEKAAALATAAAAASGIPPAPAPTGMTNGHP